MAKKPPPKPFEPFKVLIRRRPTSPALVGRSGTAVADTEDGQFRIEIDLLHGEKWARTICATEEELQRL